MTPSPSMGNGGYTDLGLVVALLVGATATLLVPAVPRPIVLVLGVPFLLMAPGYPLVATLFPAGPDADGTTASRPTRPGWVLRVALALVGSVLVVGVVGVALSLLGNLRLVPAVLAIDAVGGVGVVTAWYRRRGVGVDARADPTGADRRDSSRRLGLSGLQTLAFGASVLLLVGAIAFVGATPAPTDPYSEVSLLDNGTVVGTNGTVTLESGTENPLTLSIENHEGSERDYTIVGQLQQVGPDGAVLETWNVDRDTVTVPDGERVDLERGIDPPATADRLRLRYLVYTGTVPDDPGGGNADLTVRQWVTVVPEGST